MDHRYAGPWSNVRPDALDAYLRAYTATLRPAGTELWYVDAFGGPGDDALKWQAADNLTGCEPGAAETLDGSARRALGILPSFHRFVFVESEAQRATALARMKAEVPDVDIGIRTGDPDGELLDIVVGTPWAGGPRSGTRGVLFLDAFATQVAWSTLRALASTQSLDVWYLFDTSAITRELTHDYSGVGIREQRLDRMLSARWRDLHTVLPERSLDVFAGIEEGWEPVVPTVRRTPSRAQIDGWLKGALEREFAYVSEPLQILKPQARERLSLFLCTANPSGEAFDLARAFEQRVNGKPRATAPGDDREARLRSERSVAAS